MSKELADLQLQSANTAHVSNTYIKAKTWITKAMKTTTALLPGMTGLPGHGDAEAQDLSTSERKETKNKYQK